MQKSISHNQWWKILRSIMAFFLILIAFFALKYIAERNYRPDSLVKKTQEAIYKSGNQCYKAAKEVFGLLSQKNKANSLFLNKHLADNQEIILIEKEGNIFYWNKNQIPVNELLQLPNGKIKIVHTASGSYIGLKTVKNKFTVGVFVPLTKKILPFGIKVEIHPPRKKNEYHLKNLNISIHVIPGMFPSYINILLFLFYAAEFFILVLILYYLFQIVNDKFPRHSFPFLISFFISLFLLRGIQYFTGFPSIFKNTFWNTVQLFGLAGWRTPADLLLNLIGICMVLFVLNRYFKQNHNRWEKGIFLKTISIQLFVFALPLSLYYLTGRILQNGGLIMFPGNVYFSIKGLERLFTMFLINMFIYLWTYTFIVFLKRKGSAYFQIIISLTLLAAIFLLIPGIEKIIIILSYLLMTFLLSIIWFVERDKKPYFHAILSLFILVLSAAYLLNFNEMENRNAHQQFTANLLTQEQDPYLQYLLKNQSQAILSDTTIINTIRSNKADKEQLLSQYLNKKYFRKMLSTYSKQVTLCEPGQQLEIQPENKVVGCDAFFKQLEGKMVNKGPGFGLYLVNNNNESIYYLARFHYPHIINQANGVNLYIEFYTNIIPKGLGYPELLQNASEEKLHLSGYSFAFYQNEKLEYKFGDYLYPIDLSDYKKAPVKVFFNKGGYIHFLLPVNNKEMLIVSRPSQTISGWLLPFSLLFLLTGIMLLVYVSIRYGKQILKTFRYSFSTRLQLTIFSSLLMVFFAFTIIILYYFNINNRQTISNNLKEKTHSVMIELQDKISPNNMYEFQNNQQIQSYLQKISTIFFSDINLYNNSGWLVASSRPEIFTRGLQSKLINPVAFAQIEKNHKLFYLGKEKIKNINYYSSYVPFILSNGIAAGILNLPYFARQSELQHSYYQMLANLINLFVIAGILGMLLMIYLSRLLTRPLNILQQKMTAVSIDRQNEKIDWSRNDEIGQLIEAYNQMVDKMEESTRLLKYSEREKAWREMARQIAHEIRNPLTPMKLNVQYLQKVYLAKDPSFDEKFKSVSLSLINQIETLNEVAGMFSDFSSIKTSAVEKANLPEAVRSTATFFRKSYQIKIDIESQENTITVNISMQDLLRIFNNLLKNAVQSMENISNKYIRIQIIRKKNYAEVRLTDNGKGISETNKKRIFQPYFTTKTMGTGLGLAIVKNLMTEIGGEITFISERGSGTTFILKFPLSSS